MNSALRATGISKTYGTVRANAEVDVDIRPGEIHAILGENGAGKSTLMRILYGMEVPDSGQIELEGKPIVLRSPREAIKLGIGMVHQHFMLVPTLTVLENLILGNQTAGRGVLNLRSARAHCGAGEPLSSFRRSRSKGQSAFGRRTTTRRNSQGLGPPREDPDPGRANRGVDAAGDRRPHGDASLPRTPGLQHLHRHPQSCRGHGGQRPRECDAPRTLIGTWNTADTNPGELITHMIGHGRDVHLARSDRTRANRFSASKILPFWAIAE